MANLIKNITEVRKHITVDFSEQDLDRVQPFLDNAEHLFVYKIIGNAEFESLSGIYQSAGFNVETIVDTDVKRAVFHCQRIICNLGYLFAIPRISVIIGATGIHIQSTATMKTAFQRQTEDLKESFRELGFNAIEILLGFLESKPTKFADYIASENYTAQKQYLITSAEEFSFYFDIKGSRFLFQSLGSIMFRIEAQVIAKLFGLTFLTSLKADDASAEKKELAKNYIKPAIALLTASKSIKERIFSYNDGVVAFNYAGSTQNLKESQQLLTEKIEPLCASLETDANQFLQDAQDYIIANPLAFEGYTPPIAQRRFKATNKPETGLFMT